MAVSESDHASISGLVSANPATLPTGSKPRVLKIATWNINSLTVRLTHVLDWLKREGPDILALQETKLVDERFPAMAFVEQGYHSIFSGQKTYNGVAILGRCPPVTWNTGMPGFTDPQKRVIIGEYSGIQILNLYVPNGSEVGSDKYAYKLNWLDRLSAHIDELQRDQKPLILLGDFNIAPEDIDVHDPKEWEGQVLVSAPERAAFARLLAHGLADCYRLHNQQPGGFSWWDYRAGSFRRNRGLRIDHILASQRLASRCISCIIDAEPRALERPSDHAPVVAVFNLE